MKTDFKLSIKVVCINIRKCMFSENKRSEYHPSSIATYLVKNVLTLDVWLPQIFFIPQKCANSLKMKARKSFNGINVVKYSCQCAIYDTGAKAKFRLLS